MTTAKPPARQRARARSRAASLPTSYTTAGDTSQILGIVREYEAGAKLAELCRRHGISSATFDKWRAKYGGMAVSDAKRLRALEEENRRLKQLLADTMLDNQALKGLLAKNW